MTPELEKFIRERAAGNAKFLNLAKRGEGTDLLECYMTAFWDGAGTAIRQYEKMKKERDTMINKGRIQYRFKQNPLEKAYAKAWDVCNTGYAGHIDGRGTLDYLLAENPNEPRGEVTPRDREVAATVVQWLGSPCGQAFVNKVLERTS